MKGPEAGRALREHALRADRHPQSASQGGKCVFIEKSFALAGAILAATLLATPAVSATGSDPSDSPTAAASASRYTDYDGAGPTVQASGSDQCGLAVNARSGSWTCFGATQPLGATPKVAAPNFTSYCVSSGCYYRDSNFEVE
jgi:hypothetical protein